MGGAHQQHTKLVNSTCSWKGLGFRVKVGQQTKLVKSTCSTHTGVKQGKVLQVEEKYNTYNNEGCEAAESNMHPVMTGANAVPLHD